VRMAVCDARMVYLSPGASERIPVLPVRYTHCVRMAYL
jgi:hypothetical protein